MIDEHAQQPSSRYLHLIRQDCPLPPGTRVFIYCRDSGGEEQDRSVIQQVETAREYARHHNLVVEKEFIDEAKISSNTDKRGALQELLFTLRSSFKQINDRYKREKVAVENPFGVIFWKSNRLGRDSIEASHIKTDLRLRGVTIIDLVTSATTGNSGMDALIEAFQSWQDEQALDEISQNAKRGLAQLVGTRDNDSEFLAYNPDWPSTGAYLGLKPGPSPTGFKGEPIQIGIYKRKKNRKSGEARIVQRIVPDPDAWDRCKLAWEMRNSGESYNAIHKAAKLFKNINGYEHFFANEIYTGSFRFGDKLYENFVPAMIPQEWFDAEQDRRRERGKKVRGEKMDRRFEPRRIGSKQLLSGLVFCGYVEGEEHPMNFESIPAKEGKRGHYTFYVCTTMKNTRKNYCQSGRMSSKNLDQTVIEALLTQVLTMDNLRPLAQSIAKAMDERSSDAGTRMIAVENKLADVQKGLENIMDAIEKMGYANHLQKRYDERKREEQELLSELSILKALQVNRKQITLITDSALEGWIDHMRDALEGEDREAAHRIIHQFVAKIVIKEGAGTLYYTFPLPDALYMSSYGNVDLKRFELMTSTVRL